jgi:glutathione synthase/RimK-type ligase-like ATP-grasp enzyme
VLVIHSALGGNVPIDRFIDDRTFLKSTIVAEFFDPARTLPRHALVVNAIGDASRCRRALDAARTILSTTAAPVLNAPAHVARTAREDTAAALGDVPGVVAPRTLAFARAQLTRPEAGADLAAAGFRWPVIIRTPGFQTGKHCVLVEQPSALPAAVAELPGDELLVIAYVDVRARGDARIRKYRVIIIGGAIFPLHLAISTHWMVHYYTADTAVPEHEAEEDAFLGDAERALGSVVWATLRTLAERLGLDYGGIDFALDADGRVVLFEANATMFVPPAAMERRSARRRAVERIEGAMRKLLLARSGADAVDRVR